MRIKQSRLKKYYHKTATPQKDKEGNSYLEYGQPNEITAEIWPAGGKLQAEIYGKRLPYIRNCRMEGEYTEIYGVHGVVGYLFLDGTVVKEGDGICINAPQSEKPDYQVISIKPYRHLTLELVKVT